VTTAPAILLEDARGRRLLSTALGAVIGGLAGATLAVADSGIFPIGTSVVFGSIAVATAALAAAVASARGAGLALGRFRLATWYPLLFAVAFGLTSVSWRNPQSGSAALIGQKSVLTALTYAVLSLAGWTIGYLLGPGRPARHAVATGIRRVLGAGRPALRTPKIALVLYGFGWIGRSLQLATGRYAYLGDASIGVVSASGFGQPIALLELCTRFALVVAAIDVAWSRKRRSRNTLAALLILELAVGLFGGMKSEFVLTILGLVVVAAATESRLPKKGMIFAFLAFTVLLGFNEQYRSQVRTSEYSLSPAQAAPLVPRLLVETLIHTSPRSIFIDGPQRLGERLREIDNVAIVVQRTPSEIPYAGLRPLAEAPALGVVPRVIWPSKPLLTRGYEFAQQYYDLRGLYTSSAITPIGDLYRHAGLAALLSGMVVLGAACRLVDDELHPSVDLRLAVFFIPLFAALMNVETDAVAALASVPLLLVQSVLVCKFAFRTVPVA